MSRQIASKKRCCNYDQNTLRSAIDAVTVHKMSIRCASRSYGIPRGTLFDKINNRRPMDIQPRTILSAEEERRLADWVLSMAKIGFGRTRNEVLDTVKRILDSDGRPNPFKDNRPGKDWWYGFFKRHPELSERYPQQVGKERAIITQERVNKWYDDYQSYILDDVKDPSLLLEPSRLYNADESGFSLCPKSDKVIARKGCSNLYNFTSSDKTQITVLACMGATGHFLKPLIVYPGQRFSFNPLDGFPEAVMGRTDNGWMDGELFATWLQDVFIPEVNEKGIKKPVILFVDGHSTHMSLKVSDICRENGVELYCLLEHASHLMQPCDLRLFSHLKESWKQAVRNFQFRNIGEHVTKRTFATVFKEAWDKSTAVSVAVNGFREAGLLPMDPSKVLATSKTEPSSIFRGPTPAGAASATIVEQPSTEVELIEAETSSTANHETSSTANHETSSTANHETSSNGENQHSGEKKSTLEDILTVPSACNFKRATVQRKAVPKAITGAKFRELMAEKQKEKERLEAEKVERKRQRELKRAEKEEEKKKRQELREAKKNERFEREQQRKLEKRIKEMQKAQSKKRRHDVSSASESDNSPVLTDESDCEANFSINACFVCEEERDDSPFWINCTKCCRLLHMKCVRSIDLSIMSEEEIDALQFECDYC